ncbi:MAG: hypothetical protein IT389_03655 [Nitrospira sp.]|nr:hypothetical protein [Nitrospira sp.]
MKMTRMNALMTVALAAGVAGMFSLTPVWAETEYVSSPSPKTQELDTKPGPAFTTIDGKVSKIEGNVYVVEGPAYNAIGGGANSNEVRVFVGKDTKKISGEKRVGDKIRAELTQGGFANSIQ